MCVCQLGCCQFKMRAGGEGVSAKLERATIATHNLVRRRALEIGIFGLLMPLVLASTLYMWTAKERHVYNRPWLEADCTIERFEEQAHRLYMNGDYLRNSFPNDGIYYVLQPAWRSTITPRPLHRFERRERKACCRQVDHDTTDEALARADAVAHLPNHISNVDRSPTTPWTALAFDEVIPGEAQKCKGSIAVSLEEARAICHRDLYWTLPDQVKLNHTYPCYYVAHGATHVYLNVRPHVGKIATADVTMIAMVAVAMLLCSVRVTL